MHGTPSCGSSTPISACSAGARRTRTGSPRRSPSTRRCWSSVDGMGGHADGARAAQVTQQVIVRGLLALAAAAVRSAGLPAPDARARPRGSREARHAAAARAAPARHLRGVPGAAARQLVGARRRQPPLPRARRGTLLARSRDHSHVELLLREGLISAEQAQTHPMRNFVECCLGGDRSCRTWR